MFWAFLKTCSWKSKVKNAVKYDDYLDILLVGSIYVTQYAFFKENTKSPSSCKPRHPGSGTGMRMFEHPQTSARCETPGCCEDVWPGCCQDVCQDCPRRVLTRVLKVSGGSWPSDIPPHAGSRLLAHPPASGACFPQPEVLVLRFSS